jgi:hypothetical protein
MVWPERPCFALWRRDVAVSFAKLADVHERSGDTAKARDDLRQGQAIMARLTKLSPENAVRKQGLGSTGRSRRWAVMWLTSGHRRADPNAEEQR